MLLGQLANFSTFTNYYEVMKLQKKIMRSAWNIINLYLPKTAEL